MDGTKNKEEFTRASIVPSNSMMRSVASEIAIVDTRGDGCASDLDGEVLKLQWFASAQAPALDSTANTVSRLTNDSIDELNLVMDESCQILLTCHITRWRARSGGRLNR